LVGALLVGLTGDQNYQVILASLAGFAITGYLFLRGLSFGSPRFLQVKGFVIFSLTLILAGVGFITAGSAEKTFCSHLKLAGIPLKIAGILVHLLGIAGAIVSLAISKDTVKKLIT
jgi:hypothetical protein